MVTIKTKGPPFFTSRLVDVQSKLKVMKNIRNGGFDLQILFFLEKITSRLIPTRLSFPAKKRSDKNDNAKKRRDGRSILNVQMQFYLFCFALVYKM